MNKIQCKFPLSRHFEVMHISYLAGVLFREISFPGMTQGPEEQDKSKETFVTFFSGGGGGSYHSLISIVLILY